MKQNIKNRIFSMAVIAMTVAATLTSCGKGDGSMSFKNAEEAIIACKNELAAVTNQKDKSIEAVGKAAAHWSALQDSCYNVFLRDSTFDYDGEMAAVFVGTSDSIRAKIIDLALSRPRSLKEVVRLKVATAHNREDMIDSKEYKDVMKFYKGLDKKPVQKNLEKVIAEYNAFLDQSRLTADEKELREFLATEDHLFRSMMANLSDVSEEDLQQLTDKTTRIFKEVDADFLQREEGRPMSKMEIYITMRFNRRIMQNAAACRHDVKVAKKLPANVAANYRWMLLQPLMSIDNDSMAAVTDDEIKQMEELAAELPQLMAYLDGKEYSNATQEEIIKLAQTLSGFFLKSHLKSIL